MDELLPVEKIVNKFKMGPGINRVKFELELESDEAVYQ